MAQTHIVNIAVEPSDPFTYVNQEGVEVTGYRTARIHIPGQKTESIDLNPTGGKLTWQQIMELLNAKEVTENA